MFKIKDRGRQKTPLVRLWPAAALILCLAAANPALSAEQAETTAPWKTHLELSFVSTSGNTETQSIAGKFALKKKGPVNRYFLNGSILRTESLGAETSNRITLDARFERTLTKRVFGLLAAGYLRDKFAGYELRVFTGPGLGADFISKEKHLLQGTLMLLYYHDEFTGGEQGTDSYLNTRASAKYQWQIRENFRFTETMDFSISLKERKRYFIDSISAFDIKVGGPVSMGVSYTVNYQHAPPSSGIRHTDTTFLTSLIIDL